jgi:arabinose-5-phosphate isomerase
MTVTIQQTAVNTILLEAQAVEGLKQYIDDSFEKAVNLINVSLGRVVVSGMGKSAIIGQKIAATLNSTGTPALFMHAGDAIHGDLGMVQKDDIVLVISKSGESPEIKLLVPLIKTLGNSIIGMVGNINSFLAAQSTVVLNTTVEKEACPNNLAPTSSTTAQMVMGDALAVCLMQLKNFTGTDFAKFHPGGNLGKKLYLRVEDIYVLNEKPKVTKEASLKNVILAITKGRQGAVAVVDEYDKVLGIVTDGDIRRLLERVDDLSNITASHVMGASAKTIQPSELAVTAFEILKTLDINQLIVADDNQYYLGIIHLHDLIREGIM